MTLRHESVVTAIRFYDSPTPGRYAPYRAICTLTWESSTCVWVTGLHGDLTRPLLREWLRWFLDNGVTLVKAHRGPRSLPFGVPVGDHMELDPLALADRLGTPPESTAS